MFAGPSGLCKIPYNFLIVWCIFKFADVKIQLILALPTNVKDKLEQVMPKGSHYKSSANSTETSAKRQ